MGEITMFGYLGFRWQLRRLEREQDQLEKKFKRELDVAKQRNAPDEEIEEVRRYDADTQIHFQEEIQKLHSEYLLREVMIAGSDEDNLEHRLNSDVCFD